jgi:hypothetical protein
LEETHVSPQRKSCMIKAEASSILFPVRIDFGFERNASCEWVFQGGDRLSLLQIGF